MPQRKTFPILPSPCVKTNFKKAALGLLLLGALFLHGCSTPPKPVQKVTPKAVATPLVIQEVAPPTASELEQMAREAIKTQNYVALADLSHQLWQMAEDPEDRRAIVWQTWQAFLRAPAPMLLQLRQPILQEEIPSENEEETPDASLAAEWAQLAWQWKSAQGVYRLSNVENEIALSSDPDFFSTLTPFLKSQLLEPQYRRQVAVFLPLSGKYRPLTEQIRNGLIKNVLTNHPELTLVFYDTQETPNMQELLVQAKEEGADLFIGPLRKANLNQMAQITDPTVSQLIALNQIEAPTTFTQFGFSALSESVQIESQLCQQGYRHLGILSSQSTGNMRLSQTLAYQWRNQLLHHAAFKSYPTRRPNLRHALGSLINETQSQARKANLQWLLQEQLTFLPRTRKDLEAIVLVGNRKRVAVFKPQFKFFDLKLPVYGTSKLTPEKLTKSPAIKDLSQVVFPTIPAALNPTQVDTPLEAFGWDSLTLALSRQLLAPQLCLNDGLTGQLELTEDNQIDHLLSWAVYNKQGRPIPWHPPLKTIQHTLDYFDGYQEPAEKSVKKDDISIPDQTHIASP
jgi:hypothetical protein